MAVPQVSLHRVIALDTISKTCLLPFSLTLAVISEEHLYQSHSSNGRSIVHDIALVTYKPEIDIPGLRPNTIHTEGI